MQVIISMQKQRDRHLHIIFIVTLGIRYQQLLTDLSTEGSTVSLGLRQNIAMQWLEAENCNKIEDYNV